jgi:hypothetical protein
MRTGLCLCGYYTMMAMTLNAFGIGGDSEVNKQMNNPNLPENEGDFRTNENSIGWPGVRD